MREKSAELLSLYARLTAVLRCRACSRPLLVHRHPWRCCSQLVLHAHWVGADCTARGRVREQLARHARVGRGAAVEHSVPGRADQVQGAPFARPRAPHAVQQVVCAPAGGRAREDVRLLEAVPRRLQPSAGASGVHPARDMRSLLAPSPRHTGAAPRQCAPHYTRHQPSARAHSLLRPVALRRNARAAQPAECGQQARARFPQPERIQRLVLRARARAQASRGAGGAARSRHPHKPPPGAAADKGGGAHAAAAVHLLASPQRGGPPARPPHV